MKKKVHVHVLDRLPDYLTGRVSDEERLAIDRHVRGCKSCRSEFETLTTLWRDLDLLPDEKPSERVRERFYAELRRATGRSGGRVEEGRDWLDRLNGIIERLWPKQPAFQVALAVLCLFVGYVVGYRIDTGGRVGNGDVAALRAEVQNMQRVVMMSLLKTESASERIVGVNWSERIARPDAQVLGALYETLDYDPNVNVRLAALDALTRFTGMTSVQEHLLSSLLKQTSPLIQLALVDVVANVLDRQAIGTFRQLLKDPNLNKTVRERIENRLKDLKP